ncbi:hypothetical protein BD779DRAFT_1412470, partial [Infundibulicybe gibba]
LCQEFRELELLDEIVRLRYEGRLPKSIHGDRQTTLIHLYREVKGMSYVPSIVHKAIRWAKSDPFLEPVVEDTPWLIIPQSAHKKVNERSPQISPGQHPKKKAKKIVIPMGNRSSVSQMTRMPQGTEWSNNSCAYDTVLSILHCVW